MANLTNKTIRLLDRLFNLQGEDNVILADINKRIEETNSSIEETSANQRDNEVKKLDCEGKLSVFQNQKEVFESAFEGLDDETFAALRDIDVNIEIGTMLTQIAEKSPAYIDSLNSQIESYQSEIERNIASKEELETILSELKSDKTKSEEDRNKLVSLLEQSLSTDDLERESLTTSYVKKILSLFGVFSDEEVKELAKLIIFPDEGLYEYRESYEERRANGLIDLEAEDQEFENDYETDGLEAEIIPQEEVVASEAVKDTSVILESTRRAEEMYQVPVIPPAEDLDKTTYFDLDRLNGVRGELAEIADIVPGEVVSRDASDLGTKEYHNDEESVPPAEEENQQDIALQKSASQQSEEETIEAYLTSIGLNVELFKELNDTPIETIIAELNSVSHKTIEDNYELLRSINVDTSVPYKYRKGHMYLTDLDLSKKVTLLRAKNISEAKIKELLEISGSGLRENLELIERRVQAIENINGKLTDDNVDDIAIDMIRYEENYNVLQHNGFELEEKELRNFNAVLLKSPYITADMDILKNYLISIVRKNGKYALSVFWKRPSELVNGIDDLIEAGLEDVISTNPEILGQSEDAIIRRVKFCESNNHSVYEEGNICDYIVDFSKFAKTFGTEVELPTLQDRENTNNNLGSIIGNGDYVDILTNMLHSYYDKELLEEVDLTAEEKEKVEELNQQATTKLFANPTGKYTYKIGNVSISKNKFERHLSIILKALLNSGQSPEGVEREILLVSALYNVRQDEEILRKMVSECLGFNNGEAIGGMTL